MITVPRVVHAGGTRLGMPRHCVVIMCVRFIDCTLANSTHAMTIYPIGVYAKR